MRRRDNRRRRVRSAEFTALRVQLADRSIPDSGIWMCPSKYSSTIVMDVEGTDGRERGEDQDFERKSALFSLASTEVLLINLWSVLFPPIS